MKEEEELFCVVFKDINELLEKTNAIKKQVIIDRDNFISRLDEKSVKYTKLQDTENSVKGVALNLAHLDSEDLEYLKSFKSKSDIYTENGAIKLL